MKLIDRVAAGIDQLGKRAAQALDESKLRMEQAGVRRRRDHVARDLGYLAYRKSRGEVVADADTEALIRRISAADDELAKLEAELAKLRAAPAPGGAQPPAADAPAADTPPAEAPPAEGAKPA